MKRLGHATSCNLEFSNNLKVPVGYGEETITESNLLELRRRHSDVIKIRTFNNHEESQNGADWVWWFRGNVRSLVMRVQAKRLKHNGKLEINHKVGQTGVPQYDLLVTTAKKDKVRPMYCIYSAKSQRSYWKQVGWFETGCLLVDAKNLSVKTSSLTSIEQKCWPWHFYFIPNFPLLIREFGKTSPIFPPRFNWDGPNFSDLNEGTNENYNRTGVWDNSKLDDSWLTADSYVRWPAEYDLIELAAHNDLRWPVDSERARQIEFSPQGMVMIDVRSL